MPKSQNTAAVRRRKPLRLRWLNSMFFRVVSVTILLAVIPLFVMRGILLKSIQEQLFSERVENIMTQSSFLASQMLKLNYFDGKNTNVVNNLILQLDAMYEGRVIVIDDAFTVRRDSYSRINNRKVITPEVLACMQGADPDYTYDKTYDMVEKVVAVKDIQGNLFGAIVINASTQDLTNTYNAMWRTSLYIAGLFSAALVALAILLGRTFTRPFKSVEGSIERISEGHFDEEVKMKGYVEVERISNAFNTMLARLKSLEDSRQEFVSNVSHELKTPITSMKVLADSLNTQEDVPVELYKDFMRDIAEEIDRENAIINDLLSLVKMDKKAGDLNLSLVNINEMLELILKRVKPLASKKNIELVLESFANVEAMCDEVKMTLAISNLVENAIKYNVAGGYVQVSLDADHKYYYIKVSDSGIGIPEEHQDKIFERFYRVDKARSRESGGTGLGLSITKNIILMHDGAIKVKSREDEGTTFTVRVPLEVEDETE